MDNDSKKKDLALVASSSELTGPMDSTNRARNRTVMLTPEMTGHMRSKMMDSVPNGNGSDWEDSPQETFGGRLIGHDARAEDDGADWTRPIEPATFADDDSEDDDEKGEHQGMSWTPAAAVTSTESDGVGYTNGYHTDAHSVQMDEDVDDNAPFVPTGSGHNTPRATPAAPRRVTSHESPPSTVEQGTAYEKMSWKQTTPLAGFLVTFDNDSNGSYLPLRTGRVIVTSEVDGSGNVLLIPHESVSPMHAIMRVGSGSSVQVLDQLSESGTRIIRAADGGEELLSGEKASVYHGDIVFFGERKFYVCLIHQSDEEK